MSADHVRKGLKWKRVRSYVIGRDTHCGICGKIVDKNLPYRSKSTGKVDSRSKSVDHIVPLVYGGEPYSPSNLQLAHLGCQQRQGGLISYARRRNRQREAGNQ